MRLSEPNKRLIECAEGVLRVSEVVGLSRSMNDWWRVCRLWVRLMSDVGWFLQYLEIGGLDVFASCLLEGTNISEANLGKSPVRTF
jgi:hypothetical protein